jgi:hypothetical protein
MSAPKFSLRLLYPRGRRGTGLRQKTMGVGQSLSTWLGKLCLYDLYPRREPKGAAQPIGGLIRCCAEGDDLSRQLADLSE